jgi:phosphohistidine phosphatase
MGNVIYKNGLTPDLIVSSPARRAKQTAVLIKETTQVEAPVMYDERIYEASPGSLLTVLSEFPEMTDSVMLVGHNPGLEGLLRVLTGEVEAIPTAACAKISLNIERWADIGPDCGDLDVVMRPKELIQRVDL